MFGGNFTTRQKCMHYKTGPVNWAIFLFLAWLLLMLTHSGAVKVVTIALQCQIPSELLWGLFIN